MRIQAGKRYVLRNGNVTGIIALRNCEAFPFYDPHTLLSFYKNGMYLQNGQESPCDPIKEYKMEAGATLKEAASIVDGCRNKTHGKKERSFNMIAKLWSVYLGYKVTPVDVAECMSLMKKARYKCGTPSHDHFVDDAGYVGIASELAEHE